MALLNQTILHASPVNQTPPPLPIIHPPLIPTVATNNPPIPPNPPPLPTVVVIDEPELALGHASLLNSLFGDPRVDNAIQENS
ncbi:hypothetical protein BDV93DRAFT_612421 [Ceratobasidium sp. AG-I]|nr:hypothetical protein BDV93DRAFT_612421 [Ceratobasidium sp. AG-I]